MKTNFENGSKTARRLLLLLCVIAPLASAIHCASEPKAVIVLRNYKENFIVKRILVGYFSPDRIPPAKLKTARERLRAGITCPGYDLIEDGIKDQTQTYSDYDPVLRIRRNYEYTSVYYWQKYRCGASGGGKPGDT